MTPSESNYNLTISKEQLGQLPIERYEGKIVVVSSEETTAQAMEELKEVGMIGFDTETKPSFKKGTVNNVALIQLATPEKCYLIRLSKMGTLPESLKNFLEDENVVKIGLSIKDDFHNLNKICQIEPKGFIDLQEYAKEFRIKDSALTKIHAIVFGRRISKNQQLSNWEASSLTEGQKHYAALDAAACLNIYNELKSGRFIPQDSIYFCEDEETT